MVRGCGSQSSVVLKSASDDQVESILQSLKDNGKPSRSTKVSRESWDDCERKDRGSTKTS